MELETYCDNLSAELGGWRAKFEGIAKKFDKSSCADKSGVLPYVNDLHMVLEEFEDRIQHLRSACPTDWEPDKKEFEGRYSGLKRKWQDIWHNVSPGDFGG